MLGGQVPMGSPPSLALLARFFPVSPRCPTALRPPLTPSTNPGSSPPKPCWNGVGSAGTWGLDPPHQPRSQGSPALRAGLASGMGGGHSSREAAKGRPLSPDTPLLQLRRLDSLRRARGSGGRWAGHSRVPFISLGLPSSACPLPCGTFPQINLGVPRGLRVEMVRWVWMLEGVGTPNGSDPWAQY